MPDTVTPHHRCGIGRKHEHGPHRFRALIMGGIIRLRCPGWSA